MKITPAQLGRLQTCCAQRAQRVAGVDGSREERLSWASSILRKPVATFSALSMHEGRVLIDAAQGDIGHRAPLKPSSRRNQSRPHTPQDARRAGLDGRHIDTEFRDQPQIVDAETLDTIKSYRERLDMDDAAFEAFLASKVSPIRPAKVIRTTAQANKVRWALKGMLQNAGLWADWSKE